MTDVAAFKPAEGFLDNTQITSGTFDARYIAHIAVPCGDLDETARLSAPLRADISQDG